MKLAALLDSNVLIATLAEDHEHHGPSLAMFAGKEAAGYAVSAHSYAEAYSTLTRRGERAPFLFSPQDAWAALESVRAVTALVGLTPAQTFESVRSYSERGGVGARLYDGLIGAVAIAHDIPVIVTWNAGHMRSLFPTLTVVTPPGFLSRQSART